MTEALKGLRLFGKALVAWQHDLVDYVNDAVVRANVCRYDIGPVYGYSRGRLTNGEGAVAPALYSPHVDGAAWQHGRRQFAADNMVA